ncbi:MAG: NfeD family protein [Planctomycetota bacterium]
MIRLSNWRSFSARLALLCLSLSAFPSPSLLAQQDPQPEERQGSRVYSVPIKGQLQPVMLDTYRRVRADAIRAEADYLILEIDTPGGESNLMLELADEIYTTRDIRTVAWVMGKAWSAGALLGITCDELYMRETATIGAAAAVSGTGQELPETLRMKIDSTFKKVFISHAEQRGRPIELAEAMVVPDTTVHRVEIQGRTYFKKPEDLARARQDSRAGDVRDLGIIVRDGELLTLTANNAVAYGFAEGVAETREDLLTALLISDAEWIAGGETWSEGVAGFLQAFKVLLILGGLLFAYVEFKAPGFGLPGILAIVCFGLFLSANYVAGLADWGEILLVALGLILIAVEIFVLPGFGIAGLSGIVLLLVGLVLSMQSFLLPESSFQEQILFDNLLSVVASLFAFLVIAPIVSRFLPKLPMFRGIMLSAPATASAGGGGAPLSREVIESGRLRPGAEGTAVTDLHPAGKVRVDEQVFDVMAQGQFIEKGAPVRIVEVRGNRIVVRSAPAERQSDPA